MNLARCLLFLGLVGSVCSAALGEEPVSFNRDVRPILSNACFQCHGPDANERQAELRLDEAEDALADRGGYAVLVPGSPEKSELWTRISGDDPELKMPPAGAGKELSQRDRDILRRWIEQGAKYERHWSYLPATRSEVPQVQAGDNPIDRFIVARLQREGLQLSPRADRRTLARRISFDLTGLPPSPQQVAAFVADESPEAYEKLIDELLDSPHFGERMAMYWLDLVRYADTNGIHGDNHRDHAPYRDYVIRSFNENLPFDRFTVEQLAGDLLPDATNYQRIASGYNRLNMTTREGGAQAKEYLAKYAADRVRNASTVWLGSTLGCAECHDHKFDPFTTKDFYSFAAFFADVQETAVGTQQPVKLPTPEQESELAALTAQLAAVQAEYNQPRPKLAESQAKWEAEQLARLEASRSAWTAIQPSEVKSSGGATLTVQEDQSVLAGGEDPAKDVYTIQLPTNLEGITGLRLEALPDESFGNQGLSRGNGNFVLTDVAVQVTSIDNTEPQAVKIASASADFSQKNYDIAAAIDDKPESGWAVDGSTRKGQSRTAVFVFAEALAGGPGSVLTVTLKHESPHTQHNIGRFRLSLTTQEKPALPQDLGLPTDVVAALEVAKEERSAEQQKTLAEHYKSIAPELEDLRKQLATAEAAKKKLEGAFTPILITTTATPRMMRVLPRGNWLDDSGEVVQPAIPSFLGKLEAEGRQNRLDLARWLVNPDNPMTARVFVNRLWKLYFGKGLVRTLDDFGSQGAWPTHPRLLDWLAVEFVESGWDVKHLVRLMVTSETYQQASVASPELREKDPYNQLLARQSRFRLDAEMVRDNALAISGLLVDSVGGSSVKPYQPAGYWKHLNFPRREWQADGGADQYHRGVYTYWCRTFLHPSLLAFDAPTREECTVERPRSNTPLAALALLNDPTYVEASRVFAERILREAQGDTAARINFAFQQALSREARPEETELLGKLYEEHLKQYREQPEAAKQSQSVGQHTTPEGLDPAELAAWTNVARVVLNLHETITRD